VHNAATQLPLFPPDEPSAVAIRPAAAVDVSVRESARARRLSIKVYPRGKVEVVVPKRTRAADVAAFVSENQAWIRRPTDSFASQYPPQPLVLPQIIELPAVAEIITVRYVAKKGRTVWFRSSGDCLTLSGNIRDQKACVAAIRRWLAGFAKQAFAPRLKALAAITGIEYSKMQVRAQRSCWGSRSSSGTLSLNLCLLFLGPELLRYLMIHELCHARHMNHSKRFWQLVASFESDYRRLDRELTEGWKAVPRWLEIY